MTSDGQLVKRCRHGDDGAFAALVDRYKAYVFAIILNLTGRTTATEDIAQEVFLQVYRSLPADEILNFKAWLGRVTVNKAIDWKRRQAAREAETSIEAVGERAGLIASPEEAPEDILLRQENREKVGSLVAALPAIYRRVMLKYYFEGKSYQQIAREEATAVKTVEARLYRGRHLFRRKWEEDWHEAL